MCISFFPIENHKEIVFLTFRFLYGWGGKGMSAYRYGMYPNVNKSLHFNMNKTGTAYGMRRLEGSSE